MAKRRESHNVHVKCYNLRQPLFGLTIMQYILADQRFKILDIDDERLCQSNILDECFGVCNRATDNIFFVFTYKFTI